MSITNPVRTLSDGDGIQCPHCHAVQRDLDDYSWRNRSSVKIECGDCGLAFTLTRQVHVTYTAEAAAPLPDVTMTGSGPSRSEEVP